MADGANEPAEFSAEVMADLEQLLKCVVCSEVPREGNVYQCQSGHVVCSTCKSELGDEGRCPRNECGYDDPPMRCTAVEHARDRFPFVWRCRYAESSGCDFSGRQWELSDHEAGCPAHFGH